MYRLLILMLFLAIHLTGFSQPECQENLIKAQKEYEAGRIQDAIALISACTENSELSIQWQAYRLLSMCYLANSQMDQARTAAVHMLELNPTYRSNRLYDPAEFTKLLESITVIPKFSVGMTMSVGSNLSFADVEKSYVLGNYTKNYKASTGLQIGTNFGFYFRPDLQLSVMANVGTKRYNISYEPDNWMVKVQEKLTYLTVPLSMEYIFRSEQRLRPFIAAGPYMSLLLYDRMSMESVNQNDPLEFYSLTNINKIQDRNLLNYGVLSSLGLYYKRNTGIFNIRLDYLYSLNQLNIEGSRLSSIEQTYNFFYADDDIRLHTASLNLGYSLFINYRVYEPKN